MQFAVQTASQNCIAKLHRNCIATASPDAVRDAVWICIETASCIAQSAVGIFNQVQERVTRAHPPAACHAVDSRPQDALANSEHRLMATGYTVIFLSCDGRRATLSFSSLCSIPGPRDPQRALCSTAATSTLLLVVDVDLTRRCDSHGIHAHATSMPRLD